MSTQANMASDSFKEDEAQAETEDDISALPDEAIRQAVINASDWTTETIVSQINKGNIFLDPAFQRRDAWTVKRKSKFIESLILGLPIPQIVLAQLKERRGSYLVLDGKQRLLAIRQFVAQDNDPIFQNFKLAGLDVRPELNGLGYKDLQSDLSRYGHLTSFENQTIRTVMIQNWPSEAFLYHVFLRLNTGSLSLSPQELRQALHPGPFVSFADEASRTSSALRDILKSSKPDFRMRDAELLVRYYAFSYFLHTYSGNLKEFLDDTCRHLNLEWEGREMNIRADLDTFEIAHQAARAIFREPYRKWSSQGYEGRFNRAVFDLQIYALRDPEGRDVQLQHKEKVESIYQQLCMNDEKFVRSLEQTTKSTEATETRITTWINELNRVLGLKLQAPALRRSE